MGGKMPVKGLLHYALEVPNRVVGETFYQDFGLQEDAGPSTSTNSIRLRTARGSGELMLYEGPKKRLHHIALAAPGDEFESVRQSLKRANVREIDPPRDAPQ